MKKLIYIMLLGLLPMAAGAQRQIQVCFDYTQGIYDGHTYAGIQAEEEDFLKDQHRYEGRFFDGLNDELQNDVAYMPDSLDAAKPILQVTIFSVDRKGNLKATCTLTEGEQVQQTTIKAKGGHFGSWLNLFGDGMHSLGEQLAAWLNPGKKKG